MADKVIGGSRKGNYPIDNSRPVVSVIVVTYNAANHLQEQLWR